MPFPAIAVIEAAVLARQVEPGRLTLGTDNGSQFTSRDFHRHLSARGITHRGGGSRDPRRGRTDPARSKRPTHHSDLTRHADRHRPRSYATDVGVERFDAEGWLDTGDLGRLDEDGYLWLVGRSSELISRSGEKILPQEIEDVLREDPGIREAVECRRCSRRAGW
jgi:acyl-CoA synthetase (AMP-forming)/AMP-acid ligase II